MKPQVRLISDPISCIAEIRAHRLVFDLRAYQNADIIAFGGRKPTSEFWILWSGFDELGNFSRKRVALGAFKVCRELD
jgi:hypothetical protein